NTKTGGTTYPAVAVRTNANQTGTSGRSDDRILITSAGRTPGKNPVAKKESGTRVDKATTGPKLAGRYPELLRVSNPSSSNNARATGKVTTKKKNLAPVPDKYNCSTDEFEADPMPKSSARRTSVSQSRTNESQGIRKV